MRGARVPAFAAALAVVCLALGAGLAEAQWQVESKDGKSSIKIGFLAQPQFEGLETTDPASPGDTVHAKNLFIRRFRILFGGTVAGKWSFFFETDSPNIGRQAGGTSAKEAGDVFIQDAFVTYNQGDAFKVDVGLMFLPQNRNHLQSAASLLPIDYGPYTFTESAPLQERVGRDYGLEVRGYPLRRHLEYRLGVFQGLRGPQASNALRVAGRAVWYPLEASDTGFFYAGTFQGTRRVVGVGATVDTQSAPDPALPGASRTRYLSYGLDAFVEQPIRKGREAATAQFNWIRFDGGTLAPALAEQDTYLLEAGLHLGRGRFTPFVQLAWRDFAQRTQPDTFYWQAGAAWWMSGHQRNLKVSAGRLHTRAAGTAAAFERTQVLAQLQIFFY